MSNEEDRLRTGRKYASKQTRYYRRKHILISEDEDEGDQNITSGHSNEAFGTQTEDTHAETSEPMETHEEESNLTDYASSLDFDSDYDIDINDSSDDMESLYDSEDFEADEETRPDLKNDLMSWYLKNDCITKNAMGSLLKILKPHLKNPHELPVDARTFLKTFDKVEMKKVSGGDTVYLGIERIINFFIRSKIQLPEELIFDINIDGVEVFVNPYTKRTMWPVLCVFKNIKGFEKMVFPISFYCGSQKPTTLDFLDTFINEYQKLEQEFFVDTRRISIRLDLICMDIPAHSMVACTISHQGYNCCFKCLITGEYFEGKVVFPHVDEPIPLRTNESFRQKQQAHHHTDKTCNLLRLQNLDMIHQMPIDGMHCVYLGATKKLLRVWFFGRKNQLGSADAILGKSTYAAVSSKIHDLKGSFPSEFHRNLRGIECLNRYKAKELRMFLMYIGIFVLKPHISDGRFQHFLNLHCAIKILNDEEFSKNDKMVSIADKLLISFNKGFEDLYGKQHLSINLHLLSHLAKEVKRNGPLDSFSCFIFENFLGKLKKCIKSPNEPLKQVAGKYLIYFEHGMLTPETKELVFKHNSLRIGGVLLTSDFPNCMILLQNRKAIKITRIENSSNGLMIIGNILECTDYFTSPIHSSTINCFKATESSREIQIQLEKVSRKMVPFRLDECSYVLIPNTHKLL